MQQPDDSRLDSLLGQAQSAMDREEWEELRRIVHELRALDPEAAAPFEKRVAAWERDRAVTAMWAGEWDLARRAVEGWLSLAPENAEAQAMLAQIEEWAQDRQPLPEPVPQPVATEVALATEAAAGPIAAPATVEEEPRPRRSVAKWVWGTIAVLAVCVGAIAGGWSLHQQREWRATSQARPTAEVARATARAERTATAQVRATAAMATARVHSTARAASQTAVAAEMAEVLAAAKTAPPLSQPRSGSLIYQDARRLETNAAGVMTRDCVVEAIFFNPYPESQGEWNYGFLLRQVGEDNRFRLMVTAAGTWSLRDQRGDKSNLIELGRISQLDASAGGSNRLTLIAEGERGFLFVNGVFITELDLSSRLTAGDVLVAIDCLPYSNVVYGEAVRYEGFTVWSVAGPE